MCAELRAIFSRSEDVCGVAGGVSRRRPGVAAAALAGCTVLMSSLMSLARGSVMEAFVVYAHEHGLRDTSIEVYIAGLKHFATDAFGRPQIPGARTVKILLKGCQKSQGPPRDGKLVIGILRLRRLLDHLNHTGAGRYEITLWKAMFCCAFFAASRV